MNNFPPRLVVYTKDVMIITGHGERGARKLLARIKASYNKSRQELVSVDEFCNYTGLKEEKVLKYLK